jgi:hypothetical protein
MCLVADDEVPAAVRHAQLSLHALFPALFVEPGDDEVIFDEPIARTRRLQLVIGQDLEGEMKTSVELVLPLLSKTPQAHNQTPLQIATGDQLFNEQARHNGLARAWIVSQQKS